MLTITKTFFITGLGRSGTKFLATMLGRSKSHIVIHEQPNEGRISQHLRWFPIQRFLSNRLVLNRDRGYGEVNSHLRYALHPQKSGLEVLIERRGIVFRDPRDVITSVMNRRGRTIGDFDSICMRVLDYYNLLLGLRLNPSLKYETFFFSEITSDRRALEKVANWAGIEDCCFTDDDVVRKINVNKTEWFPKWVEWEAREKKKYLQSYSSIVSYPDLDGLLDGPGLCSL